MILSVSAVVVLTLASSLAWAASSDPRDLPLAPTPDADGYSMAAPQAAAAEGKMNVALSGRRFSFGTSHPDRLEHAPQGERPAD